MEQFLAVYPEKCTACKLCELACSMHHAGRFNPAESRIKVHVLMEEHYYLPMVCMQCKDAPCAAVCPTNCITLKRDSNAYIVEDTRCIGCRMCVVACPFGVIEIGLRQRIEKCDNCDGAPKCVEICPTKALEFRRVASTALPMQRSFADKMLQAQKEAKVV